MAYVSKNRYDRLLKPAQTGMETLAPGARIGGPGGPVSAATPGAPAAPNNPQASTAGGFVSFGQRLAANQGGADAMAGKVAAGAEKGGAGTLKKLDQVQRTFNTKVQEGSLSPPDAKPPMTLSEAQSGQTGAPPAPAAVPSQYVMGGTVSPYNRLLQPIAQPAPPTPSTVVPRTVQKLSDGSMRKMETDRELSKREYTGPEDLRGVQGGDELEQDALNAEDRLAATRDNAGLQGLVDDAYAGGRTSGGSALDAALTGAAGGERFAELRRKYDGLTKLVSDANTAAKAQADAAKVTTADMAKQYGTRADDADARAKADADKAQEQSVEAETRRIQDDSSQWLQNSGASAMVQRAWIEAGRPPLGPWLQQNSPALYAQYSTETQTKSSGGLKGTPQK